jgi:hypothetical protein
MLGSKHICRAVILAGAVVGALGASAAMAAVISDPTGSVAIGTQGSNAEASLVAVAVEGGCARSGGVAVTTDFLGQGSHWCGWAYDSDAPVAIAERGSARGAIVVADYQADPSCWNPVGAGCMPTIVKGGQGSGNVVYGNYDVTAYDYGPVPGVAYSWGSGVNDDHASSTGSIATNMSGAAYGSTASVSVLGDARGGIVAVSGTGDACGATVNVAPVGQAGGC